MKSTRQNKINDTHIDYFWFGVKTDPQNRFPKKKGKIETLLQKYVPHIFRNLYLKTQVKSSEKRGSNRRKTIFVLYRVKSLKSGLKSRIRVVLKVKLIKKLVII